MSTSHRICETCVYCSLAGNCDRYNKPLTSIEQPACDAYEIHPLLAENDKLRELVRELSTLADQACDAMPTCCQCPMLGAETCDLTSAFQRMCELGVEV